MKAAHEKEVLAGMIDATDRQIDRLVYDLYGLTEDGVPVVGDGVMKLSYHTSEMLSWKPVTAAMATMRLLIL